jgi:glucokinase
VGVDIGGTKLAVGMIDDSGRVVVRRECATEPARGPASGLDRISRMVREAALEAGAVVSGIGIGSTGPVDPIRGTIGKADTLPGWEGTNLIQWLSNEFQIPVALENDADAAALGEAAVGAGRGESVFVYVTISTGIGTGVVLDGRLYRGVDGSHPEIGHLVVEASGPMCYCGARGCWEAVASGPSMAAWAASRGLSNPDGSVLTAAQVCALAAQGNDIAREVVGREAYYIGVGLGNLISSFCPGTIALGGGVMRSAHLFMDRVREVLRTNCTLVPYERAKLVMASLGADAGLVGAWRAWHHRFKS